MKLSSFEAIISALNGREVRYLVAGGMAVIAHGYLRFTKDVDVVLAMDRDNIFKAFDALAALGFRPMVPVTREQIADPAVRKSFMDSKGMQVLNFFSDEHMETKVDVFVTEPFDFEREYAKAYLQKTQTGETAAFVSLDALVRMKEQAGRPNDLDDVQHLRWIREDLENGR